jgi:hypothetical protein
MSLLSIADKVPPFVCRIVARKNHGWQPMSIRDIAEASGIKKSRVAEISRMTSWRGIAIEEVDAYSRACGVDLENPWKTIEYIRESKFAFMENASARQRRVYKELFQLNRSPEAQAA